MTCKLIMLPQPILCSDEEPNIGESVLFTNGELYLSTVIDKISNSSRDIVLDKMPIGREKGTLDYREMKSIIAGIEGLPKLDLSAIAEKIGWVDVEKLSINLGLKYYIGGNYDFENGVRKGILEYQSLNEKKYTLADIQEAWDSGKKYGTTESEFYNTDSVSRAEYEKCESKEQFIQELSKPKEYNIECIQEGNTIKVAKIL